jgi:hypothetical protein
MIPAEEAIAITAVRQQIIGEFNKMRTRNGSLTSSANASVLFPMVVDGKRLSLFRRGETSPEVLFEVAVLSINDASAAQAKAEATAPRTQFQAILTCGLLKKHTVAAQGDHATTMFGALNSLLEVTACELANRQEEVLASDAIKGDEAKRSAGGLVSVRLARTVRQANDVRSKVAKRLFEPSSKSKKFKKRS